MKIKFAVLFTSVLLISSCGGASKDESLSAEQLSAYVSGYDGGRASGCYEDFKAKIGDVSLYANNTLVSYAQCLSSIGAPDYGNSNLHSDMSLDWPEDKGFGAGVGRVFDFAFIGGRSLCFGSECITENSILSDLG